MPPQWLKKLRFFFLGALLIFSSSCFNSPGQGSARRVVLIGIDGMTVVGLEKAAMPNVKGLMSRGAWSLQARAVMPTISAPNWASILNGAGPEQHGVTSNSWTVTQRSIVPVDMETDGYFPDIFYLMHQKMRRAKCGLYYDWPQLINLFNLYYLDRYEPAKECRQSVVKALPFIVEGKADFTFIYFGTADETAHVHGFESPKYLTSMAQIDSCIGEITFALEKHDLLSGTHILIVSGHGGVGMGHGGETMNELLVPWIIAGPKVKKNHEIATPVNVYDTAPMIAYLFGLRTPECWIGKPVVEVFRGK